MILSRGHGQRHLAVEAASGGDAMPAVGVDEAIPGHVPQPELERHGGVGQIVAEPTVGLDHHVLHDVAGIHPPLHDAIHPLVDHPADRRAMAFKQAVDRVAVSLADAVEQHKRWLRLGYGRVRGGGRAAWGVCRLRG